MPYRQMEGFTRKLSLFVPGLRSADYTTLFRRIRNLDLSLQVNPELLLRDVVVAVDSTGIKVTNRGEWMREKWRVRRGWIKVHTMIDVETGQILGLEVTDESVQDDASTRSRGSAYRAECVRMKRNSGGYRPWAEETGYGQRWKIEGVYSAVKRIFGESVQSSSREGMMRELMMKFQCYNMLVAMSD